MSRSCRHRHRYQRLSDTALFCACGEVKQVVAPWPAITVWPVVPYIWPSDVPQPTWVGGNDWPTDYPTISWSASA